MAQEAQPTSMSRLVGNITKSMSLGWHDVETGKETQVCVVSREVYSSKSSTAITNLFVRRGEKEASFMCILVIYDSKKIHAQMYRRGVTATALRDTLRDMVEAADASTDFYVAAGVGNFV